MVRRRTLRTLRTLSTLFAAVVVAACPKPLDVVAGGPSQLAPDSIAVLRLPKVERAEAAARAYLKASRGAKERSELESMLRFVVAGKSSGAALLGLARDRSLLVSWRPSGELLVWLPVRDPALFDIALDRLLEARGAVRDEDTLGVRVYRDSDESVAMLARVTTGGALLWPAPRDALAAAALLDALAAGRVRGRWPTGEEPPPSDASAELVANGAGVAQLSPMLSSLFGGAAAVTRAHGALHVDDGAVHLQLDIGLHEDARARVAAQVAGAREPPPRFCALVPDALALARLPVAVLKSTDDDGPLDELEGQLAIAIVEREDGPQPGWIALGRPAGLSAREELLASVRAAGVVERRREPLGERTLRVFAPEGASEDSALIVIAEEDLFVLSSGADNAIARITDEGACDDDDGASAGVVYLLVKPRELAATLSAGQPAAGPASPDPVAALRRLAGRLPDGFTRLEASVSLDEAGVTLSARGDLAARSD